MDRVLDPAQIEALASRSIPRLILPARDVYAARARRLAALAPGHAISGYLALAARVATAQQAALDAWSPLGPGEAETAAARDHSMPVLPALGMRRDPQWRQVLRTLVAVVAVDPDLPSAVREVCATLGSQDDLRLEERAARVLEATGKDPDPAGAVFIAAALAVLWTALAMRLSPSQVALPQTPGPCPVCGTAAVASIVRSQAPYGGYRYLCCGLCATQWHRVRVECTQCSATKSVAYQSIEGAPAAVRAETCDDCHGYRKIFYQEHDPAVEALADDLASLSLDLMLTEAGLHRAGANPLYWQPAG